MSNIIYKEESYKIMDILFDIHNQLGKGFLKIVYKDVILKHKFYADFIVFDKIILELRCCKSITDSHIAQAMNYLKVSDNKIAIIVNFNNETLEYKRIII